MTIFWSNPLTPDTYVIYGIRYYNNIYSNWDEYFSDLKQFSRISKNIMTRKALSGIDSSSRSILNNYISLGNVFTGDSLARLGFFLSNPGCYSDIKSILYFMNRLPGSIPEVKLGSIDYNAKMLAELQTI